MKVVTNIQNRSVKSKEKKQLHVGRYWLNLLWERLFQNEKNKRWGGFYIEMTKDTFKPFCRIELL